MRRRGSRLRKKSSFNWSFDTLSDVGTDNAFLIRRVIDNVEQTFTYTEVIDGTYAAFISGSQGGIKEWIGNKISLKSISNTSQPLLNSTPFVDDNTPGSGLVSDAVFNGDLANSDYCVSLVIGNELNGSNQRSNFKICSGTDVFSVMLMTNISYQTAHINVATTKVNSSQPDFSYNKMKDGFKILIFHVINKNLVGTYFDGVKLTANETAYSENSNSNIFPNKILLGVRDLVQSAGKITPYKHAGITYNVNPIELSNSLNAKYSIY